MTEKTACCILSKMRTFIINQGTRIAWCPVPDSDPSEILIMSAYAGYVVPGTLMEALPPEAHKTTLPFSEYCPHPDVAFRDPCTKQHTVVCTPDHIEKGQINLKQRDLMVFEPLEGEQCIRKLLLQHNLITPIKRFAKHWVCFDYVKMVAYDGDMHPLGCFAMIQKRK